MGRPAVWKNIPADEVEKLAVFGCTNREIGEFYGVDAEMIRSRFMENLTKGRAEGRIRLRKAQMVAALEDRNVTMQIWLGKQMLGQSDKVTSHDSGKPLDQYTEEELRDLVEGKGGG